MSHHPQISVTIVTYNSARFIQPCLESLFQQTGVRFDVTVIDNASADGTREILKTFAGRIRAICNTDNIGFAAAQNQAIQATTGEWVLVLNPDVFMLPGFLAELFESAQSIPTVGTVCGKLLSIPADLQVPSEPAIDSTGMYFTPAMRHFDRGWHEPDKGQYDRVEYVFGASAAAALYRRSMIDDIADADGNFFDPDFFAYREDADVAWRAQMLGWTCLYTPHASAYHVRRVSPANRHAVPPVLNMHSVKNRFLMRIKNTTAGIFIHCWPSMLWRDLQVVVGCLTMEPTSLPAFWQAARCIPKALERRRHILARRRVADESLARWFHPDPVTEPAVAIPAQQLSA